MKTIYLLTAVLITSFSFGQITSSTELPGDFEMLKGKEFVYDGKSGFVFFERMIYEEVYEGLEWWTSMKKMWKRTYLSTDTGSKKYNAELKEELSKSFPFPYQLLKKYELKKNLPVIIDGVLDKERYVVDFVITTMPVNQGGNTYTNYYIYDMKENKQYFVKATLSMSKLLTKLNKMIEEK